MDSIRYTISLGDKSYVFINKKDYILVMRSHFRDLQSGHQTKE
jgi:hypothetical protein